MSKEISLNSDKFMRLVNDVQNFTSFSKFLEEKEGLYNDFSWFVNEKVPLFKEEE